MSRDDCVLRLKELTGQSKVLFVKRGNVAIRTALKLAKSLGFKQVFLQDQGGWMTYKQFCDKERLLYAELKTDYGLVDPKSLESHKDCALLVNSMPGYHALQDMTPIAEVCKKNKIFVINDVSGSISTKQAIVGDVILGSFGKAKPVNAGEGGFIATSNDDYMRFFEKDTGASELDFKKLEEAMNSLSSRLVFLQTKRTKLLASLKAAGFEKAILHENNEGINVIVKFVDDAEKERLINIASDEGVEYTTCPRDIRVLEEAVCFEVKRLS
ncbi:DegT/DnrJ/EryC1/StrS family aminotransferase [Candidatus Woesearchaeota archaeon]|nr:DegT/DnrJ/EryC1/StrS family aminotransferase [Candidatus Woesearchaeota archaeon]